MINHTWRARNWKIFRNIHVNTSFAIAQIQREIKERIYILRRSKRAHRCLSLVSRICNYIAGLVLLVLLEVQIIAATFLEGGGDTNAL